MKISRILILVCTLFLFLCGCRDYETADLEVDCSPVPFSLNKEELANPPQDPKEQEYSHLNQPLHLIPRELFTTPNGIWTEYVQTFEGNIKQKFPRRNRFSISFNCRH